MKKDLENVINQLPESIKTESCSFEEYLQISKYKVGYYSDLCFNKIEIERKNGESIYSMIERLKELLKKEKLI
jgi:hypothetical protein